MRLPAVAIAAAFAGGIMLGLHPAVARNAASLLLLSSSFVTIAVLVLTGIFLVKLGRLFLAASASLLSWVLLGFLGVCIAEQPRHADHVISLVEQGRVRLKTPLRWHGHLRDEPTRLPWGYGYEIELSGVEFEEALHPARGGLRVGFTARPEGKPLPDLHAGDEVAVLTEARRPQVFRDEGAFDRRAYLKHQNIDLVATLRAPELIERIASPTPTIGTNLARARKRLRDEIDELLAGVPQAAGVLRAMLLGDRSFVDQAEAVDFQKTGVFHVLIVAGLHVGALAFALYWAGRKLRLSRLWTMLFTLTTLSAYVAVVEQRAAVCARAARLARRNAGRRSRATRNPIQNRSAFAGAGALDAPAAPAEQANGRRSCWRIVSDVSRVGVAGAHDGVAGRNVAVDGSRFSSHTIVGTACEPGSRSADRCRRPTRISDPGSGADSACGGQAPRGSAWLANRAAFARCPVVRTFSTVELPHSRATVVV